MKNLEKDTEQGKIGNLKRSGRLGNQIFQYHFLHQLVAELDVGYFQSEWTEILDFQNTGKCAIRPFYKGFNIERWSLSFIQGMTFDEILQLAKATVSKGANILLPPGILGHHFLESCRKNPRDIVRFKEGVSSEYRESEYISLHFRAGDFKLWDEKAILSSEYYLNALEMIPQFTENREMKIRLFTDEILHPTIDEIRGVHPRIEVISGTSSSDFRQLANSEIIISSPSTFAVWAAILGRDKKLIMSKDWLDYACEKQQKFWIDLRSNLNPYLKIDLEV